VTDPDLVLKKLARIETCVQELRRLADPAALESDVRQERFVEHTLQIAIQSAIDAAAHVVADERLGEPRTQRELFDLLQHGGWLPAELLGSMRAMCGFRNILVHGYDDVDLAVVRDVLAHGLEDLLAFVLALRGRLNR
jgi:uncharacterized protein YutE (UPF0331/DUF86 family)